MGLQVYARRTCHPTYPPRQHAALAASPTHRPANAPGRSNEKAAAVPHQKRERSLCPSLWQFPPPWDIPVPRLEDFLAEAWRRETRFHRLEPVQSASFQGSVAQAVFLFLWALPEASAPSSHLEKRTG